MMIRFLVSMSLLGVLCAASATAADTMDAEIAHLIGYLQHSDCRFERNGSWYDAGDAVRHIRMKYEYFADKGKIRSAEDFIEYAATKSTFSGEAYHVKCPGTEKTETATWFESELERFRRSRGAQ